MYPLSIKKKAQALRKDGKTYGEIRAILNLAIPKSTLSNWCSKIELTALQAARLEAKALAGGERGRVIAHAMQKIKRREYLASVRARVSHLAGLSANKDIARIILGILYLGEGGKHRNGSVMLGNSDPGTIELFLRLLRYCYSLDNSKFRCTLQCRADQDIESLEQFWSNVTQVPRLQFYKARIDPRSIGKVSLKTGYKGVCKVEYFSADIYHELMCIGQVLCEGL